MTRKRRKTRSRQERLRVELRGALGKFRAQFGRLERRLRRGVLLYGSSFVKVYADGGVVRAAPLTAEEFHETAQAFKLVQATGPHWTDGLPSVTRWWDAASRAWVKAR